MVAGSMTDSSKRKVFKLEALQASCRSCRLHELCLPVGIPQNDVAILEQIVEKSPPIPKGSHLFNAGDNFSAIYVPRSGALKTVHVNEEGEQAVVGFHLPGELVGLDGLASDRHSLTAEALETTSVCRVGFDQLEAVARKIPALQRQLGRLMSKEFLKAENHLLLMGNRTAEARLAIFLISLSKRFEERGFSPVEFNLPMSRIDIAAYLGLASETVSRLFTNFRDQAMIATEGRLVTLLDLERVQNLAGESAAEGAL